MRVLFWGTPDFATPALRALIGEGFDVVGVVTQPDKPQGRSRTTLVPPPVKLVAMEEDIQVLQPAKPRGEEFVAAIRALEPDISIAESYGFNSRELSSILRTVTNNRDRILRAWHDHFSNGRPL